MANRESESHFGIYTPGRGILLAAGLIGGFGIAAGSAVYAQKVLIPYVQELQSDASQFCSLSSETDPDWEGHGQLRELSLLLDQADKNLSLKSFESLKEAINRPLALTAVDVADKDRQCALQRTEYVKSKFNDAKWSTIISLGVIGGYMGGVVSSLGLFFEIGLPWLSRRQTNAT